MRYQRNREIGPWQNSEILTELVNLPPTIKPPPAVVLQRLNSPTTINQIDSEHRGFWESEYSHYSTGNWRLEKIVQLVPNYLAPGASILDVGCNIGLIGQKLPGFKYTGVDLLVDPTVKQNIFPYDINSLTAPPGDEMFDCIIMSGVIEYSYAPRMLLSLLIARLKPGGYIMLSQMNHFFLTVLLRKLLNFQVAHHQTWNHTTDYTMLRQWLQHEGLQICQEVTVDTCFTHRWPIGRIWERRLRSRAGALPDVLSKQNLFIARKGPGSAKS